MRNLYISADEKLSTQQRAHLRSQKVQNCWQNCRNHLDQTELLKQTAGEEL